MHVTRITTLSELSQLRDPWNGLARGVPFRTWDWQEAWWRHVVCGATTEIRAAELYILCVWDDGQLIGIAPWYVTSTHQQGRVLRFLASGGACSDYLSVLCRPGREREICEGIADWMCEVIARPGRRQRGDDAWDMLDVNGVDADDPATRLLIAALESRHALVHTYAGQGCWRVMLPPDWNAYLTQLSKHHRKQARRLVRRLTHTTDISIHDGVLGTTHQEALHHLVDLHQQRQHTRSQSGCFDEAGFEDFIRDVSGRFAEMKRLRTYWIELNGRAIAAELQFLGNDVVYAYQGGIDPQSLGESPGWAANLIGIRRAINEGSRAFDFLRGDEPYKRHFRARLRACLYAKIVPPVAISRMRHGVWRVGAGAKQWLKDNIIHVVNTR